ncbi:MAG: 2-octaprenylphenol hydroxylase [Methylophilaceae bacterium]|jgi:2-octaprenylphenol hydroxylase
MANKTQSFFDVAVVGAGLVGLAAVIALAEQGKRVVLVDAKERPDYASSTWDTRIYAITPATEAFLKALGVWAFVNAARINPVKAMALWHEGASDSLNLLADDANLDKLACIVENNQLMHALWERVDALDVTMVMGSPCTDIEYQDDKVVVDLVNGQQISASLLVAADGVNSFVRQQLCLATNDKDFDQVALVANYVVEKAHGNVARQWFSPHETLALLPLPQQQVSMVWALETERAKQLLSLSEESLAEQVEVQARGQLGQLKAASKTYSFPLRQITASKLIAERVVLIGDASHQVHPMAGQGANLGFRDVMSLAKLMTSSHALQDIGDATFLRRYERDRKADVVSMNALTSGLDYLFSSNNQLMKRLATSSMEQLEKRPSIKNILIKQAVA